MAGSGNPQTELKTHQGTYNFFTALLKWGTIVSFIVAAIVILIIAN